MKDMIPLTAEQIKTFAERMPEILRAALADQSLTGLNVSLAGVKPEELCHPLTAKQLAALLACTTMSRQTVEAEHLPDAWLSQEGLMLFRVRYDLAGYDADGNAVSAQDESVIGLACSAIDPDTIKIADVEHCRLRDDGTVKRPGWLKRRMRRWLRHKRRDGLADVGDGFLEVLGCVLEFVFEVVVEAIFDG